jgi:hypothetical protein
MTSRPARIDELELQPMTSKPTIPRETTDKEREEAIKEKERNDAEKRLYFNCVQFSSVVITGLALLTLLLTVAGLYPFIPNNGLLFGSVELLPLVLAIPLAMFLCIAYSSKPYTLFLGVMAIIYLILSVLWLIFITIDIANFYSAGATFSSFFGVGAFMILIIMIIFVVLTAWNVFATFQFHYAAFVWPTLKKKRPAFERL